MSHLGRSSPIGWPLSPRTPPVMALRDLLLPLLWLDAWRGDGFIWRGHCMDAAESARTS